MGAGEVAGDAAQVVGGELPRQAVKPFADGRALADRPAEVVVEHLRGAGHQVVGLQARKVVGPQKGLVVRGVDGGMGAAGRRLAHSAPPWLELKSSRLRVSGSPLGAANPQAGPL